MPTDRIRRVFDQLDQGRTLVDGSAPIFVAYFFILRVQMRLMWYTEKEC